MASICSKATIARCRVRISAGLLRTIVFFGICVGTPDGIAATTIDLANYTDVYRVFARQLEDYTGLNSIGCDLNADGLEDLVISAPFSSGLNNSRPASGEVSVIFGRRGRWLGQFDIDAARQSVIHGADSSDETGTGLGCGDVDGDGYKDLVVGVEWADGPANGRIDAGEVRIIRGSPQFPSAIDLAISSSTVIYGELANGRLGSFAVGAGDVNADGTDDILLGSNRVPGKIQGKDRAGRVYVLFGRTSWPSAIDLATTPASVTIYGRNRLDILGSFLTIGDYDLNGKKDILIAAPGEDGPAGTRIDSGSTVILVGRTSWPASIDLAIANPSQRIYGFGANDFFSDNRGLALGDLDLDGRPEVVMGARLADGRNNTADAAGESRSYQPPLAPPATADLATSTRHVIYGLEASDVTSTLLAFGDFNRDGHADLGITSGATDGSGNLRIDSGEIDIFYSRPGFTTDQDIDAADVVILGAQSNCQLAFTTFTDVNADGFAEANANSNIGWISARESHWLLSPFDFDGDGVSQLADNCPLVANADQLDTNNDLLGDACTGDYDGDGQQDSVDCAPSDAAGGLPAVVPGLQFAAGSKSRIVWMATTFANRFDVLRGDVAALPTSDLGACQNNSDPNLADTEFDDPVIPPPGNTNHYLVRGVNTLCKLAGTWGKRSDGTERLNSNPAGCP